MIPAPGALQPTQPIVMAGRPATQPARGGTLPLHAFAYLEYALRRSSKAGCVFLAEGRAENSAMKLRCGGSR
jgi:hypothetical protein